MMSRGPKPILVVDDDIYSIQIVQSILTQAGYTVVYTQDPLRAVPLIGQTNPGLVILDLNMPGADGITVLDRIRQVSVVTVVILTAEDKAESAVQALRHGAYEYLTKPVDRKKLLDIVLVALGTDSDPTQSRRISHYELRRELGRGGMGVVYEARDRTLDRLVALKVLQPELAADPQFELRFLAEARAAARLSHPGLVTVFEAGRYRGQLFIAMELVEGETLQAARDAGERFRPADALSIAGRVAEALDAAHEAGLIHRDIKPANIMLTSKNVVKILDFGLVRSVRASQARVREVEDPVVTPAYAAPETLQGEPPHPRTDIYSLGVVLYELLSNMDAFAGATVSEIIDKVSRGQVHKPISQIAGIPPDARALVEWMMAVDPANRPASMKEVLAHLLRARAAMA